MIVYNYKISDLLNNSQVLSLYRAGSQLEKNSEFFADDSTVSDEDESLLKKYLRSGCALIASALSGYTKDLYDVDGVTLLEAYEFDITYETVENSIVFRVNMPSTFRSNAMLLIDDSIKDGLENYVLYRVAKLKQIESETYFSDWETQLGNVRSYLTRRTDVVKRSTRLF